MMTFRKLSIQLNPDGSVLYHFDRDRPLQRYLIEHPDHQVEVLSGTTPGFARKVDPGSGHTRLTWVAPHGERSFVNYRKREMIVPVVLGGRHLYRYQETVRIKASGPHDRFGVWLNGLYQGLSAIKDHSTAEFSADSGRRFQLKPRQLSEYVFADGGELRVSWVLEQVALRR